MTAFAQPQTFVPPVVHEVSSVPALELTPTLRFTLELHYSESYLPTPRHRTPRKRPATCEAVFFLRLASRTDAPLVMVERGDATTYAYRAHAGTLYREAKCCEYTSRTTRAVRVAEIVADLKRGLYDRDSLEQNVARVTVALERYLVVDGCVYERHEEPYYRADRRRLRVEHGHPEGYMLRESFNALEYDAAQREAHPEALLPRRLRNQRRHPSEFDTKRDAPAIRVLDPRAVRLPGHAAFCALYDEQQVERGARAVMDRLGSHPSALQGRILERCLSSLTTTPQTLIFPASHRASRDGRL